MAYPSIPERMIPERMLPFGIAPGVVAPVSTHRPTGAAMALGFFGLIALLPRRRKR